MLTRADVNGECSPQTLLLGKLADGGYQGDLDAWVKDNYEFLTETAEAMVSIAFIQIALNRFF